MANRSRNTINIKAIANTTAELLAKWLAGRLVEALHHRRGAIRRLITEFRRSSRNPFPNWRELPAASAMPVVAGDRSLEAQGF